MKNWKFPVYVQFIFFLMPLALRRVDIKEDDKWMSRHLLMTSSGIAFKRATEFLEYANGLGYVEIVFVEHRKNVSKAMVKATPRLQEICDHAWHGNIHKAFTMILADRGATGL